MQLLLIKKDKIDIIKLPSNIFGSYWIIDKNIYKKNQNLINVFEEDGKWKIVSNDENKIIESNGITLDYTFLSEYSFYYIKTKENAIYILYACPIYDNSTIQLDFNDLKEINIGKDKTNEIVYDLEVIGGINTKLIFQDNKWRIIDLNSKFGTYLNNESIKEATVENGDIIFIMGLKIIIVGNSLLINNPFNVISYNQNIFKLNKPVTVDFERETEDEENIELYKEEDYFSRSPRFKTLIEKEVMVIDSPPAKQSTEEMPMIYIIGPMLTMSMMSLMTVFTSLNRYLSGEAEFNTILPSLIIGFAMMISMILWPLLNKRYQKKKKIEYEKERQTKYGAYIDSRRELLEAISKKQRQILIENYLPAPTCEVIINNRNRQLWERKIEQPDFLATRLGIGNTPLEIDIKYPESHFSMYEDNLQDEINRMVNVSKELKDVPISISFLEKNYSALVGKRNLTNEFIKEILLQFITFHSYEDLKLVFFMDEKHQEDWEYLKTIPHVWSDDKTIRYFATGYEEMKELSSILEQELQGRINSEGNSSKDYKSFIPYYVIITNNYNVSKNIKILGDVLKQKTNYGYSVLVINETLSNLPNECTTFISIDSNKGGVFESELISTKQKEFFLDKAAIKNLKPSLKVLANTPIKLSKEMYSLPKIYTFLEMFEVGKVEQLNSLYRWKTNDSIVSLQTPIGIDSHGMISRLDVHEKAHGPHGLIAGMTGSGKSELILSYIVSLAVNYHPDDVSFVLIDYKGGFLVGALQNNETGMKLPHLAGSITNLDNVEMNRSLLSIQSELKRRQRLFNEVREQLGESTIDIYKYQKFYHEGLIKEPIPHLLIISDEFAELKTQQSEFMEQLISTARIGRSLGVHLILSTQKPSGVVNDQIWSNSRFKICLKVQEKADSMDVIKSPDAASLKQVGRYYLQVGYNEYFSLGQSAWTGAKYFPSDKIKKEIDTSIDFINNIGMIVKEVEEQKNLNLNSEGEQLTAVVNYLSNLAKKENISIKQLWLDRIPDKIYLDKLIQKYNYKPEKGVINPIIGEYDDPFNQYQGILTMPLSKEGNAIIYGSPDSGKELLLNSMIYSSITSNSVNELNYYLIDFGTESLRVFTEAPQVGDVLYSDDIERVNNIFKMIKKEINNRKKIFSDYYGDYQYYLKNSGKELPTIVIVINNFEAFQETYPNFEEEIIQITREGPKYGIVFVFTVTTSNSIRYKLSKNFRLKISLQLNDENDYSNIFDRVRGKYPSKVYGRGLIELNTIHEFQTSYIKDVEDINNYIISTCSELKTKYKERAKKVLILPEKVTLDLVSPYLNGLSSVPIGIEKEELEISTYNFEKNFSNIITSQDFSSFGKFINALISQLRKQKNTDIVVLDNDDIYETSDTSGIKYYRSDSNQFINDLIVEVNEQYALYQSNNFNKKILEKYKNKLIVIIGIEKFKSRLTEENQKLLEGFFSKSQELFKHVYIFVENVDKLKKLEYDNWYRSVVNTNQGIWLGSGIADQFSLKLVKVGKELYQDIGNGFGYVVIRGNPVLIKLIEQEKYEGEIL